jgi:hypothetical protein
MMFHLPRRDQSAAFESVSRVLKPGASFLFTGADIDGAGDAGITGTMNGVTFRYYAVPSYRELVVEHGFVLVDVHDDPGVARTFLPAGCGEAWRNGSPMKRRYRRCIS